MKIMSIHVNSCQFMLIHGIMLHNANHVNHVNQVNHVNVKDI